MIIIKQKTCAHYQSTNQEDAQARLIFRVMLLGAKTGALQCDDSMVIGWNIHVEKGKPLGTGTYSVVLKGTCLGQEKAIKIARPKGKKYQRMICDEIAILRRLSHDNIINIHDSFLVPAMVGSDVTYLQAYTMDKMTPLAKMQPLKTDNHVCTLVMGMFKALHYLEGLNIYQNDPKPGNILWDGSEFKLADFGMVVNGKDYDYRVPRQTRWYRAPENLMLCDRVKETGDVWSMALVVLEAVTGHPIFAETTSANMVCAIHLTLGIPLSLIKRACSPTTAMITIREMTDWAERHADDINTNSEDVISVCHDATAKIGEKSFRIVEHVYNQCLVVDPHERATSYSLLQCLKQNHLI